ncbi:MAG: hypothetical protein MJ250_01585 [Alphaproteobacteria bacterium]|nr:hypothetical protein [Alphaproteobacteria bacterium]
MMFHKRWFSPVNKITSDERKQIYGLSKFMEYDSVILGTSMLLNTSAKDASKLLDGTFFNLSFSGANPLEKAFVFKNIIKSKKIKKVLGSLDWYFTDNIDFYESSFNKELYEDKFVGFLKAHLDKNAVKCLFFLKKRCDYKKVDLDMPFAWKNEYKYKRRFGGFENWLRYRHEDKRIEGALNSIKKNDGSTFDFNLYIQGIQKWTLDIAAENPNIQFYLIVPPYSALYLSTVKNLNEGMKQVQDYLYSVVEKYENIKIFWFYDKDFVFDIANYMDLTHYSPEINSYMLEQISKGNDLLTKQNIKKRFDSFLKNLKSSTNLFILIKYNSFFV